MPNLNKVCLGLLKGQPLLLPPLLQPLLPLQLGPRPQKMPKSRVSKFCGSLLGVDTCLAETEVNMTGKDGSAKGWWGGTW